MTGRRLASLSLAAVAVAIVSALLLGSLTSRTQATAAAPCTRPNATAGLQQTRGPWSAEHRFLARRLAGLALPAHSDSAFHIHAYLAVFIDGRRVRVPANLGIDPGLRHMESVRPYPFTLGQLFTVWGVRFGADRIGAYVNTGSHRLAVVANGRAVHDPVHYVMRRHDSIVVGYGTRGSFPRRVGVAFPAGL